MSALFRPRPFIAAVLIAITTSAMAQNTRDKTDPRRASPSSRAAPAHDDAAKQAGSSGSNTPFENQLKKFSAPLSANGR